MATEKILHKLTDHGRWITVGDERIAKLTDDQIIQVVNNGIHHSGLTDEGIRVAFAELLMFHWCLLNLSAYYNDATAMSTSN